jgi:hypothetical protein
VWGLLIFGVKTILVNENEDDFCQTLECSASSGEAIILPSTISDKVSTTYEKINGLYRNILYLPPIFNRTNSNSCAHF